MPLRGVTGEPGESLGRQQLQKKAWPGDPESIKYSTRGRADSALAEPSIRAR